MVVYVLHSSKGWSVRRVCILIKLYELQGGYGENTWIDWK